MLGFRAGGWRGGWRVAAESLQRVWDVCGAEPRAPRKLTSVPCAQMAVLWGLACLFILLFSERGCYVDLMVRVWGTRP